MVSQRCVGGEAVLAGQEVDTSDTRRIHPAVDGASSSWLWHTAAAQGRLPDGAGPDGSAANTSRQHHYWPRPCLLLVCCRYLVSPTSDELQLDVFMSESVMPQTVLLLGQPKLVKALLRESPHSSLAKVMQVWLAGWEQGCRAATAQLMTLKQSEWFSCQGCVTQRLMLQACRL